MKVCLGALGWLGLGLSACASSTEAPATEAVALALAPEVEVEVEVEAVAAVEVADIEPPAVVQEPATRSPEPAITAESVMAIVRSLPGDRSLGAPGHGTGRQWIVSQLEQLGMSPEVQRFAWAGAPDADLANIELVLPGSKPDGPLVVACAHYDTVPGSGGADDNGSGVAVLLEVARRSAQRAMPGEVRLLWFDAEELGLAGSRAWLEQLDAHERERLVGAINLETVGFVNRRPSSQWMPPGSEFLLDPGDVGDFVLVIANQDSADFSTIVDMGLHAESGAAMRVEMFDRLPGVGWLMPDSRRSDHASFWDVGIPAVMLTDTANFRNPNYHRRSDLPETLDGEFLAAVGRGVERALLLLASDI
ncbi:MAG: hypothetical protein ACI9EF_001560 [Pseudohongiellaceae bacterium]|jgi:hypothetical protein